MGGPYKIYKVQAPYMYTKRQDTSTSRFTCFKEVNQRHLSSFSLSLLMCMCVIFVSQNVAQLCTKAIFYVPQVLCVPQN